MLRELAFLTVAVLFFSLAACESESEQGSSNRGGAASDASQGSSSDPRQHEPDSAAGHAHSDQEALPLLPIMLKMSADMAALMQALWLEDYENMAAHAGAVAAHPNISAEELKRIAAELGPEMAAFEAADEAVHQASLHLRSSAESRDLDAFLGHLATVQRGCVECHSKFRERLRTTR